MATAASTSLQLSCSSSEGSSETYRMDFFKDDMLRLLFCKYFAVAFLIISSFSWLLQEFELTAISFLLH